MSSFLSSDALSGYFKDNNQTLVLVLRLLNKGEINTGVTAGVILYIVDGLGKATSYPFSASTLKEEKITSLEQTEIRFSFPVIAAVGEIFYFYAHETRADINGDSNNEEGNETLIPTRGTGNLPVFGSPDAPRSTLRESHPILTDSSGRVKTTFEDSIILLPFITFIVIIY